MKALCLDTTFLNFTSAGIILDDGLKAVITLESKYSQETKIVPVIDNLLKTIDIKLEDIDLFITTLGPGSFTGLRIGIAFMISMANTLNKPIAGVSSLAVMRHSVKLVDNDYLIVPMIDAKLNRVFSAVYDNNRQLTDYLDIEPNELCNIIRGFDKKKIIFTGDGYTKYKDIFDTKLENIHIENYGFNPPDPYTICRLGIDYYNANNELCKTENISPIYLRRSEAENNLLKNI